MVHNYGEGCYFASVHAEVDAKVDIMVSHDLMDKDREGLRGRSLTSSFPSIWTPSKPTTSM